MPQIESRNAQQERNPHGDGRYIPALDGWRAIAILLVMLFHGILNVVSGDGNADTSATLRSISRLGALGVLIFFAISGYIITTRLYAESQGGTISLSVFYLKRCFRILPALWMYLITLCVLAVLGVIHLTRADLFAPVFLTNYFPGSVYTAHFWSLSIEEHFYLLWPLCLVFAGWRRALPFGAVLFVLVGIYRAIRLTTLGVVESLPGVAEGARGYFLSHTEARIDYILAGCMLALVLIYFPAGRRVVGVCGTVWGTCVLVLIMLFLSRVDTVDVRSLQAVIIALIVVSTSLADTSVVNRVLSNPALVAIGKISFSLYLWQQLFLARTSIPWLQSPVALLVRSGGALVLAWCSYRLVERPSIRVGRASLTRWNLAA